LAGIVANRFPAKWSCSNFVLFTKVPPSRVVNLF
jgi:hypothetical protein